MEGRKGLQGHEASGPVYHDEARSEDAGHRRWLGLWDRHAGWQGSHVSRQDRIVHGVPSGSEIRSIVWVAKALTQTEPLGGLRERPMEVLPQATAGGTVHFSTTRDGFGYARPAHRAVHTGVDHAL